MQSMVFKVADQQLRMSEAQAIALKDYPSLEIPDENSVGPFEKGREYRLPRWIAEKLRGEGVLELKETTPIINTEVSKILWREVRSSVATKLPDGFYARLRNYLRTLRTQVNKTGKPAVIREEEQAMQNMRDLLSSRLQKILRLTMATNPPVSALEGLSPEEDELYQQVREIIDSWTQELQDL